MSDLLPGEIAYFFIIAVLDAALLSWLALRWYRRSVRRLMLRRDTLPGDRPGQDIANPPSPATAGGAVPVELTFVMSDRPGSAGGAVAKNGRIVPANRGGVVLAYGAGAAVFSLVITIAVIAGGTQATIPAWFAVWWAHGWPIVPTLMTVLVMERAEVAQGIRNRGMIGAERFFANPASACR